MFDFWSEVLLAFDRRSAALFRAVTFTPERRRRKWTNGNTGSARSIFLEVAELQPIREDGRCQVVASVSWLHVEVKPVGLPHWNAVEIFGIRTARAHFGIEILQIHHVPVFRRYVPQQRVVRSLSCGIFLGHGSPLG